MRPRKQTLALAVVLAIALALAASWGLALGAKPPARANGPAPTTRLEEWIAKQDGRARLTVTQRDRRKFWVIATEHMSSKAAALMTKRVAPAIRDPSTWLFLVEGARFQGVAEVDAARAIAAKRGIPTFDPVIDPYRPESIDAFRRTPKGARFSRRTLMGIQAIRMMAKNGAEIADLANHFRVSTAELEASISETESFVEGLGPDYRRTLDAITRGLMRASNDLSAHNVQRYLDAHPALGNVLLMVGGIHRSIYQGKKPSRMR